MKILTKNECDEILQRITANEIIQLEYGLHDIDAEMKATENRARIAAIVGGIKGVSKVKNTLAEIAKGMSYEDFNGKRIQKNH